jgi:hypothetical protein
MSYTYYRCASCYYCFKNNEEKESITTPCPFCGDKFDKFDEELSIFRNAEDYYSNGGTRFYSMALGRVVDNEGEEEKIMASMGFIRETKLDKKKGQKDFIDKWLEAEFAKEKEIARLTNIYEKAIAEGKSKEEAIAEAFSAEDALSGKLNNLFSNKGENRWL